MQVSSTVTIYQDVLDQINKKAVRALEKTGDALMGQVKNTQVMPFDTGTLQNASTSVDRSRSADGIVTIISATPYARRLYYHPEYDFQRTFNIAAGGEWFTPWEPGGRRSGFVPKAFARFMKEEMG